MIVFGAGLSPFVRKVLVFADEKGIEVQSKGVSLKSQNPDFRSASPFGKMPALRDGDYDLADSTAIVFYLEALTPEPELIPARAQARGRTLWYEKFAETIFMPVALPIFFNRIILPRVLKQDGDFAAADTAEREGLPRLFDYLEGVVPTSGFLVEDRLTLADLAVASPFVNLEHAGVTPDPMVYPKLAAYLGALFARTSFKGRVAPERAFLAG